MKAQISSGVGEVGVAHDEYTPDSTTTVSLRGTMDWLLAASSILIMIYSSLMFANGTYSNHRRTSVHPALYIGGHLSIQAWLAIVGVEFSLLGTVVIPRMVAVFISKYLTKRLTGDGMLLSTLLNLHPSAPMQTQLRWGMKRVMFLRLLVIILAGTGSILYKFSFVTVDMGGIFAIQPASQNTRPFGTSTTVTSPASSVNLLERLQNIDQVNGTSLLYLPLNSTTFPISQKIIMGPQLNATSAKQLLVGKVQSCIPYSYSSHDLTATIQVRFDTFPLITDPPYNNAVRFMVLGGNYTNYLVDINSSPDGALQAFLAEGLDMVWPGNGHRYTSLIEVKTEICRGYTSWNTSNSIYQEYFLQTPQDIGCIREDFDVASWNASHRSSTAKGFIEAFGIAGEWYTAQVVDIILATLDHETILSSTDFKNLDAAATAKNTPKACLGFSSEEAEEVGEGMIIDNGTGMTSMGLALQAIALFISILAVAVLFWPSLPLLGEWPAQWLGLTGEVGEGMAQQALRGTSVGQNAVKGGERLFLTSRHKENGSRHLVLTVEKGEIANGKVHW